MSRNQLDADARRALQELRNGTSTAWNRLSACKDGVTMYLPPSGAGNTYYEHGTRRGRFGGGGARLVGLFGSEGGLVAAYYSDLTCCGWREVVG